MNSLNKRLMAEYSKILQESKEFQNIWQSELKDYSGLFFAGVPECYENAQHKILIIGRETRGWGKQFNINNNLSEYIEIQINKASEYLAKSKNIQRNERGSSFHNFVRDILNQCEHTSIAWGNLNCYSWKKGRCDKSPLTKEVDALSNKLLKVQIDILKPHIIILAHGVAKYSIQLRQKLFPNNICQTILEPELQLIHDRQLWKFSFPWAPGYNVTCFRIHHPSSISKASRLARQHLIDHLKRLLSSQRSNFIYPPRVSPML